MKLENLKYKKYPHESETIARIKQVGFEIAFDELDEIKQHNYRVIDRRYKLGVIVFFVIIPLLFLTAIILKAIT